MPTQRLQARKALPEMTVQRAPKALMGQRVQLEQIRRWLDPLELLAALAPKESKARTARLAQPALTQQSQAPRDCKAMLARQVRPALKDLLALTP